MTHFGPLLSLAQMRQRVDKRYGRLFFFSILRWVTVSWKAPSSPPPSFLTRLPITDIYILRGFWFDFDFDFISFFVQKHFYLKTYNVTIYYYVPYFLYKCVLQYISKGRVRNLLLLRFLINCFGPKSFLCKQKKLSFFLLCVVRKLSNFPIARFQSKALLQSNKLQIAASSRFFSSDKLQHRPFFGAYFRLSVHLVVRRWRTHKNIFANDPARLESN